MGLTDAHAVYGVVLARLFHERLQQRESLVVPATFSPALAASLRRASQRGAPWGRFLAAGVALASLPDVDVVAAAVFRDWDATHRGPTHSLLFWLGSAAAATVPLAAWLRVPRTQALCFALACVGSHLASDWVGNAGLRLWWPLSRTRYGLGCVTVFDAPLALANALLFLASSVPALRKRPTMVLGTWLALVTLYLRWRGRRLQEARGHFDARHRLLGDAVFVHPWALFPRTFSLIRASDGAVIETVTTSAIASKKEFIPVATPNLSHAPAVRRMYRASRILALDALGSLSLSALFWVWQALLWHRRYVLAQLVK
jgi:membrane-bound metal-dependent hydrolase YbcI (DUF457 family)